MSYIFSDCDDSDDEFGMMVDFVLNDMEENKEDYFSDDSDETLKRRRDRSSNKLSHWERPWGVLLGQLENDEDATSYQHRLFRRRFRLPYPVFKDLATLCRQQRVFEERSNSMIPLEIKLLVCLRILGRGSVADDIVEYTGLGETTVYNIFKTFLTKFTERCYHSFVHFPTGDELRESMEVYAKLGFPGCIGSIDGTRIPWDRCPKADVNHCTGKEGYPTVAFQCVVNHMRKIYHVSSYFYGNSNDMTISYYDPVTSALLRNNFSMISPEADQSVFTTIDRTGKKTLWKGVYMISDQGYQEKSVFMSPYTESYDLTDVMWAEWLESVRKDVECTFGILKSRFRFLKYEVRYKRPVIIEAAFKTAAILHNMLLSYDEIDQIEWENISPDDAEPEIEDALDYNESTDAVELLHNNAELQPTPPESGTVLKVSDVDQTYMRNVLMEHFTHRYFQKKLFWPRSFNAKQKKNFKLLDRVLSRTLGAEAMKFYVADTSLSSTLDPPVDIGKGLFSNISLACDQTILFFHGYLCTWEQVNAFGEKPNGYYTIELKKHSLYLDCYQHYQGGLCLASYANSPKNAVFKVTNQVAKANAKLVNRNQTAKLVATKIIQPNEEILWSYGRFKFPITSTF